jgi:hypothetical protein
MKTGSYEQSNDPLGEFLYQMSNYQLLKEDCSFTDRNLKYLNLVTTY